MTTALLISALIIACFYAGYLKDKCLQLEANAKVDQLRIATHLNALHDVTQDRDRILNQMSKTAGDLPDDTNVVRFRDFRNGAGTVH